MQVFCSLLIAAAVNAHPGHGDVVQLDQSSAIEAASRKLRTWLEKVIRLLLVRTSWRSRRSLSGSLVVKIWTVSYVDSESNQHLEMIFSMTGNFISFSKTAT